MGEHKLELKCSPGLAELLEKEQIVLLLSTYQAGKVLTIGAINNKLYIIPRPCKKPMGIALDGDKLAIASLNEVNVYRSTPRLAGNFPKHPNFYDTLFMPRATYYTGSTDIHDLVFYKDGLIGVNTLFNCLVRVNDNSSFHPIWFPNFIDDFVPEDRCHLNGLAMENGEPRFLSALSTSNTKGGWRDNIDKSGVIIDYKSKEIILGDLGMPHSPRMINGKLYFLQSAHGLLSIYDLNTRELKSITLPGFARGMETENGLLFIALSKIRKSSKSFSKLPIKDRATHAGFVVLDLNSGYVIGQLTFGNIIEEIYDVRAIVGFKRPFILNSEDEVHNLSIATEDSFYWRVNKTK